MTTRPTLHVTEEVGATAGALVQAAIEASVGLHGRCRLAVSGGTSPVPVFSWLARHLTHTPGLVLTWVDERHAPTHGPDWKRWPAVSNRRLVWEHWFSKVDTPPREVPLDAPGTLQEALAAVARTFAEDLGGIDVALLGIGSDGHLASLFPGHPALDATAQVVAIADAPKSPPERLTLSLGVLAAVDAAVLVATGTDKGRVLARALRGDRDLPIGRYRPVGAWAWVLDPAAARALEAG